MLLLFFLEKVFARDGDETGLVREVKKPTRRVTPGRCDEVYDRSISPEVSGQSNYSTLNIVEQISEAD